MLYTFVPRQIDTHGTCLAAYADGISQDALLRAFPAGRMEGYYEPEKGYDQDDVGFECVETGEVFNVYARWGAVRVGAHNPDSLAARALVDYLRTFNKN